MLSRVFLALGLIFAFPGVASAGSDLSFRVWLDDRAVGRHSFQFLNQEEGIEVVSSMNMEVKVLFVPVFKYEHTAREIWRGPAWLKLARKPLCRVLLFCSKDGKLRKVFRSRWCKISGSLFRRELEIVWPATPIGTWPECRDARWSMLRRVS